MRTESPRDCPIRGVLGKIGDKWSVLVLLHLHRGRRLRFAELRREISDISPRMLTVTLRKLEREGLVERTVTPVTPPRVDYALSALGRSLIGHFDRLADWAARSRPAIEMARNRFDGALASVGAPHALSSTVRHRVSRAEDHARRAGATSW